jgi:hypothetical protein
MMGSSPWGNVELLALTLSFPFQGATSAPNQDESRVVGLRRGEKFPSLLTTDFFVQKINLNSASRLW